jgi:hypothetical protein
LRAGNAYTLQLHSRSPSAASRQPSSGIPPQTQQNPSSSAAYNDDAKQAAFKGDMAQQRHLEQERKDQQRAGIYPEEHNRHIYQPILNIPSSPHRQQQQNNAGLASAIAATPSVPPPSQNQNHYIVTAPTAVPSSSSLPIPSTGAPPPNPYAHDHRSSQPMMHQTPSLPPSPHPPMSHPIGSSPSPAGVPVPMTPPPIAAPVSIPAVPSRVPTPALIPPSPSPPIPAIVPGIPGIPAGYGQPVGPTAVGMAITNASQPLSQPQPTSFPPYNDPYGTAGMTAPPPILRNGSTPFPNPIPSPHHHAHLLPSPHAIPPSHHHPSIPAVPASVPSSIPPVAAAPGVAVVGGMGSRPVQFVTWNILSHRYCPVKWYPYCVNGELDWSFRSKLLLANLGQLNADVLCLQVLLIIIMSSNGSYIQISILIYIIV